jgi:hypothetical protein
MLVVIKLNYVDELSGGRKRFRRRYLKAVAEMLGDGVFQVAYPSSNELGFLT